MSCTLLLIAYKYLSRIWPTLRERKGGNDTWGDEVECQIIRFKDEAHDVDLVLEQKHVLSRIEEDAPEGLFDPEFARYMVETSPKNPYTGTPESLLEVQRNLEARREKVNKLLPQNERLMTLSVFPLLGAKPMIDATNGDASVYDYDNAISDGPYSFAKNNIEARSKREANVEVPVYQDINTTLSSKMHLNHILFGPGACGLQATFQCKTLAEARTLHDQFIVLGPIFLALTASTPIYQGILVDTDARWNQTSAVVDDRPEDEFEHLHPRWATAPMYLGEETSLSASGLDKKIVKMLRNDIGLLERSGMDPTMAAWFSYLHLHDPLYLNAKEGKHEQVRPEDVHRSICASVWSHVRLKVPEVDEPEQGWRVEFRPMEVQITDFANAAFLIFLDLVRQALAWKGPKLSFAMPLALVRENMNRAHQRDAVTKEKFWFPRQTLQDGSNGGASERSHSDDDTAEWTIDEIINGRPDGEDSSFPGLLPLVERYLDEVRSPDGRDSNQPLHPYLDIIRSRARGRDATPARWMRDFVQRHPTYKKDSRVSRQACYDMLKEAVKVL